MYKYIYIGKNRKIYMEQEERSKGSMEFHRLKIEESPVQRSAG
jgi:hypothetical protein